DVAKALQYAKEGAPVLAAVVSGEALRVVDMFKNKAEEAGINAKVIVADFSKGYLEVLREVAEQIARSQGG
ncbi:MAG: ABC transporter substrate-binding protein, partial [Pyrobaculum sp.]